MLVSQNHSIFGTRSCILYFISFTSIGVAFFSTCSAGEPESKIIVKIEKIESVPVEELWRSSFFEDFTVDKVQMQIWTHHHFLYPVGADSAPVALVLIGKNDGKSAPRAIRLVSETGVSLKRVTTPSSAGETLFKLRFQRRDCAHEDCPGEEVDIMLKDKILSANDQVLGRLEPDYK